MQQKGQSKILSKTAAKLLSTPFATFFLDPIIPKVVSIYLRQYLNRWKKNGLLKDYEVEVQRVGRLQYRVKLRALAAKKETKIAALNYISSNIKKILT